MSTITKEWLKQKIADMEAARDEIPFGLGEDGTNTLAALRIALASLEAEHGEYLTHVVDDGCGEFSDRMNFSLPVGTKLYTAPPAPVAVPDEVLARLEHEANHLTAWHHIDEHSCKVYRRDLLTLVNACRAAMLNQEKGNG